MAVFTDAFTAGSDTELHAYNSVYTAIAYSGSSTVTVSAAGGHAVPSAQSSDCYYRAAPTGYPSGSQVVQADVVVASPSGSAYLFARVSDATSAAKMYALEIPEVGTHYRLLRIDSDSFTELVASSTTTPDGSSHTYKLTVEGTGATVTLKWYLDGVLKDTYADSDAARLTSGALGFGFWAFDYSTTVPSVDNFVVDSLSSTYTQSVAGTITPAGTIKQVTRRKVTGTVTPAGALAAIGGSGHTQAVSGTVTPAGSLVKRIVRKLSGSLTSSGSLTGATSGVVKTLLGSVGLSGVVRPKTQKKVGGTVSPSATIAVTVGIDSVVGSVGPAGVVKRTMKRGTAGTATPVGALLAVRLVGGSGGSQQTTAVGSVGPVGALRKLVVKKALSGFVAPIADVATAHAEIVVGPLLSGSVASAGQVGLRLIRLKPLTPPLTPPPRPPAPLLTLKYASLVEGVGLERDAKPGEMASGMLFGWYADDATGLCMQLFGGLDFEIPDVTRPVFATNTEWLVKLHDPAPPAIVDTPVATPTYANDDAPAAVDYESR